MEKEVAFSLILLILIASTAGCAQAPKGEGGTDATPQPAQPSSQQLEGGAQEPIEPPEIPFPPGEGQLANTTGG